MYTEYPEEKTIVFNDDFDLEIYDELLEKTKQYKIVVLPPNYSQRITSLYTLNVKIGIYTINQCEKILEIPFDSQELITQKMIENYSFMESAEKIVVGKNYPYNIDDLPDSFTEIIYEYKYSIKRFYPNDLKIFENTDLNEIFDIMSKFSKVIFTYYYNKSLIQLPDSVTHITFEKNFNQSIDILENCLYLTNIEFYSNSKFNQLIDCLPKNLTYLHLSGDFNCTIDNLPESLQVLKISSKFNQPIDNLPPNLTTLSLQSTCFNHPIDYLPNKLEKLFFSSYQNTHQFNNLPNSIKHLVLDLYTITETSYKVKMPCLPNGIIHLELLSTYPLEIDGLPESVKKLILDKCEIYAIKNLPPNLEYLVLGDGFYQEFVDLPDSIKYLELGKFFNYQIIKYPSNLKKLIFGALIDKPIINLPNSIEYLQLNGLSPELSSNIEDIKKQFPNIEIDIGQDDELFMMNYHSEEELKLYI